MLAFVPMEWGKTETVNIPHWCDDVIHKIIENYNLKWKNEPWIIKFLDRRRLTKEYRTDFFNEVDSYIKVNEVERYASITNE